MKKHSFYPLKALLICLSLCLSTMAGGQDLQDYFRDFEVDSRDGKYGLTFRGEVVEPHIYDAIEAQDDERGFITRRDGKYGAVTMHVFRGDIGRLRNNQPETWKHVIEKRVGKDVLLTAFVIPCSYDKIEQRGSNYWITLDDKQGVRNSNGYEFIPCKYDEIEQKGSYYWVTLSNKKGVLNSNGYEVVPCKYDSIEQKGSYYWITLDNKKGVRNSNGYEVVPCKYDKIEQKGSYYWVTLSNKKGVLNSNGYEVVPCKYDEIEYVNGQYRVFRDGKQGVMNHVGGIVMSLR